MNSDSLLLVTGSAASTGSQILTSPAATSTGSSGMLGAMVTGMLCAALAIFAASPSTGSSSTDLVSGAQLSGAPVLVYSRTRETIANVDSLEIAGRAPRTIAEEVLLVRQVFSLTKQHLSRVFGVTRLAVYKWADGTVTPREKNRVRLTALAHLAERFRTLGGRSVGLALHTPTVSGLTLMELLREDPLPEDQINRVLASLAKSSARRVRRPKLEAELVRLGMLTQPSSGSRVDKQQVQLLSEGRGDTRPSRA